MGKSKRSRFQDDEVGVKSPNITWEPIDYRIRYKLFNNQIKIDLKEIVDRVLREVQISGFNTDQMEFTIPYDIDDTASDETFTLLIDKKRFHIRLPEMQANITKQQKIGHDNTHPHRWNNSEWIKFIEKKFWDTYGFASLELGNAAKDCASDEDSLRGPQGGINKGVASGLVTLLKKKVMGLKGVECNEDSVVEYIVWAFTYKADKIPLSLRLLTADTLIQEWVIWKRRSKGIKAGRPKLDGKWRD